MRAGADLLRAMPFPSGAGGRHGRLRRPDVAALGFDRTIGSTWRRLEFRLQVVVGDRSLARHLGPGCYYSSQVQVSAPLSQRL
jgi:hypothetical protein